MRSKVLILVAALLLGGVAAFAAVAYVGSAKRGVEQQAQAVEVLVAKKDVARGTPLKDMMAAGMIGLELVPQKFVAAGAVSTTRTLDGQVLSSSLGKGEQLTQSRFQFPSSAGLSYTVPKGLLGVSIPYTETRGVGGLVKPGDSVAVLVTMPDVDGKGPMTRIMIPRAKVLAVGSSVGAEPQAGGGGNVDGVPVAGTTAPRQGRNAASSVTLALPPEEAEKLVFAQENAKVWLSLLPPDTSPVTDTEGQTSKTLFTK